MEKFIEMSYLLDIYGNLLTEKQADVLNQYYNENLSLSEIGGLLGISRQGAYDLLKRSEHVLAAYDEKLNLLDKYLKNSQLVSALAQELEGAHFRDKAQVEKLLDALKENL